MIASLAVEDTEKPWRTVLRQQTVKMLLADHYASQEIFGSIKTLKDIDVKSLHDQVSRSCARWQYCCLYLWQL